MVCNFECLGSLSDLGHAATLGPQLVEPILCLRSVPQCRLPYDKSACALLMPEPWDIERGIGYTLKKIS